MRSQHYWREEHFRCPRTTPCQKISLSGGLHHRIVYKKDAAANDHKNMNFGAVEYHLVCGTSLLGYQ